MSGRAACTLAFLAATTAGCGTAIGAGQGPVTVTVSMEFVFTDGIGERASCVAQAAEVYDQYLGPFDYNGCCPNGFEAVGMNPEQTGIVCLAW